MYLGISLALLLACGFLWAGWSGLEDLWDRLVGAPVFALAQLVVTSLTVGMLPGGYRPLPLTGSTAAVFLVLLALAWRKERLPLLRLEPADRPYWKAYWTAAGITLPVWLWVLFNGVLLPPIYWDELYYQLIAPAVWARAGQVHQLVTSSPFVQGYPANFGFITGWSMAMTGTDVWVDLAGLPFVFLGLGVVMGLCRELGVRPWHSCWAGILFVTTPLVIMHAKACYIDLPMSVVFGAALYFLYRYVLGGGLPLLTAAGIAMGLVAGAKYSGAYMAIFGLVPFLFRRRADQLRKLPWRQWLLRYCLPVALLGGYWYVRNLLLFGNPLHPMRFEVLGVSPFGGHYRTDAFTFTSESSWITLSRSILQTDSFLLLDSYYGGFGPQLLLLAIPGVLLFLGSAGRLRPAVLAAWLGPMLLGVASLPAKYPRYLIYLSLLLLPFFGWLLDRLSRRPAQVVKLVAVTCAVYGVIIGTPVHMIYPWHYNLASREIWTVNTIGAGSLYAYTTELAAYKGGPMRIATGPLRLTYPLLGPEWQNEVIRIPALTEETWLVALVAAEPDIFVFDDSQGPERTWAEAHPEIFRPLIATSDSAVFLVIPGRGGHQRLVERLGVER